MSCAKFCRVSSEKGPDAPAHRRMFSDEQQPTHLRNKQPAFPKSCGQEERAAFPRHPVYFYSSERKIPVGFGGGQRCSEAPGAQPAAGAHLPGPFPVPPAPLRPGAALPAPSAAPRPGGAAARPGERRGRC